MDNDISTFIDADARELHMLEYTHVPWMSIFSFVEYFPNIMCFRNTLRPTHMCHLVKRQRQEFIWWRINVDKAVFIR